MNDSRMVTVDLTAENVEGFPLCSDFILRPWSTDP